MNDELRVTWIRTSTLLIECGGYRVLTDPWFGRRMRILPVFARPGIPLDALGPLDLLLVSHLHGDHFSVSDARAIAERNPGLQAVSCPGSRAAFAAAGLEVTELAAGEQTTCGPLEIQAVRCVHTGPPPEEVNFAVRWGETGIFFGGDARLSEAFTETGEHFRTDLALLPIGGTLIFGTRTTMNPPDALQAARALGARFVIPTHEGMEWMPVPPASWHPGRTRHFEAICAASDGQGPTAVRLLRGQRARFTRTADSGELTLVDRAAHPDGIRGSG